MSVTEDVLKLESFWLNVVAPLNMPCIEVTDDVSKLERSWLKLQLF